MVSIGKQLDHWPWPLRRHGFPGGPPSESGAEDWWEEAGTGAEAAVVSAYTYYEVEPVLRLLPGEAQLGLALLRGDDAATRISQLIKGINPLCH